MHSSVPGSDEQGLAAFGYKQRLDRSVGQFAAFAVGVSFISILTGVFQLFYFGYAVSGPGYWWAWVLVAVGQMTVALVLAELAARYPLAGSVYQWAKRVGGPTLSWLTGWLIVVAACVAVAAISLGWQVVLPQISSSFQFIGDGTGKYDLPGNGVVLGSVLIVVAVAVNSLGVRTLARVNSGGVAVELVAAVMLIVLLFVTATRGPDVVVDFDTSAYGAGRDWGYFGALLIAAIAASYVITGFDTACSLAEETVDPKRNAPRALLRAVLASCVIGGLLILSALMAANDLAAEELGVIGMPFIVKDALGNTVGNLFLWAVIIAISVCCMAAMAAGTRMLFAMARDNNIPGSRWFSRIAGQRGAPIAPNVLIAAVAIVILLVNVRQTQIILVVTSLVVALYYVAYLLVTGAVLVRRLRGEWPPREEGRASFSLGSWGLPVNILAVIWGVGMTANLLWPRQEVYNATEPFHWYLQYGALLFVGGVIVVGLAWYLGRGRHRTAIQPDHRAAAPLEGGPETLEGSVGRLT